MPHMQANTLIQKAQQLLTTLALIVTVAISAQELSQFDKLSDDQLINYMRQYESQGFTEDQLILAAKAKGATDADIEKFRARLLKLKSSSTADFQGTGVAAETTFFGVTKQSSEVKGKSAVFGASFFQKAQANQSPNLNPATPEQYQLGPGDQISIVLWGASSNVIQATINVNGQIVIEGVGPIGLSGKTIAQARGFLKGQLSAIFEGLGPQFKNTVQEVNLDISLLKARSIVISIVGQVSSPGAYTLNGFSSVLMALYTAGGVTDAGSYRNVQVLRNNKVVSQIDLYQYLVRGVEPTFTLRDQDVIFVPYVGTQVTVSGGLRQSGIFELKQKEKISDLIQYAGGFSTDAYPGAVTVTSFDGLLINTERITSDYFDKRTLSDGSLLNASVISETQKNRVSIEGAVPVAGSFGLEQAQSVSQLITLAQGLKPEALDGFALLYRTSGGNKETTLRSIDLQKSLSGEDDPKLQVGDRLVILSEEVLEANQKVSITGLVKNPGAFNYYQGMTASDLIAQANGIIDGAELSKITVYRMKKQDSGLVDISSFMVSLDDLLNPIGPEGTNVLLANDLVVVRLKDSYRSIRSVSIQGEVNTPGVYAIENNFTIENIIDIAGGLTPRANSDGIYIERNINPRQLNNSINEAQEEGVAIELPTNTFKIPVLLDNKDQLLLNNNDKIIVSENNNSVAIIGSVLERTIVKYDSKSLKYYIDESGGFDSEALKRKVYVVYPNQKVAPTKNFLFLKSYPKVAPGSTVVVPKRLEKKREKLSVQELLGITTSIATMGILINNLIIK